MMKLVGIDDIFVTSFFWSTYRDGKYFFSAPTDFLLDNGVLLSCVPPCTIWASSGDGTVPPVQPTA